MGKASGLAEKRILATDDSQPSVTAAVWNYERGGSPTKILPTPVASFQMTHVFVSRRSEGVHFFLCDSMQSIPFAHHIYLILFSKSHNVALSTTTKQ